MSIFLLLAALGAGLLVARLWAARRRRRALLQSGLTPRQRAVIEGSVPLLRKLPPELRDRLEGKINLFLNQVEFVGCNGLDLTEEIRLSIAAQACLLVVNTDTWYANLRTILVYPSAFKSRRAERQGFVVTERETVRTGESWARGPVILSWADARLGAIDTRDGHNVVFHEFAHQIDDLSGRADGIPLLDRTQSFAAWQRVFADAFTRHVRQVESGHGTVLDPYGATGPEEFFAVAVELFFERPAALKQAEPEAYAQLQALFHLDPSSWP